MDPGELQAVFRGNRLIRGAKLRRRLRTRILAGSVALKYRRPAKGKQKRPAFAPRYEACPVVPGDEERIQAARADHLCELAWDGHRMLAVGARLIAADHRDWTKAFDPIVRALKALPGRNVLDGFVCVLDAAGRPSFDAVKAWAGGVREGQLVYVAWVCSSATGSICVRVPCAIAGPRWTRCWQGARAR